MWENLTKVSTYCISQPSFSDRGQMPTSSTRTKYGFISQKKALKGRVASLNSSHVPVSFLGHKTSFPEASEQLPLTSHWADTGHAATPAGEESGNARITLSSSAPVRVSEGEGVRLGSWASNPVLPLYPTESWPKLGLLAALRRPQGYPATVFIVTHDLVRENSVGRGQ